MKSNRTMKVKINKKHPRQSLKICRGYLFVFCGSIFIIRRSVCSVISPIRTSALGEVLILCELFLICIVVTAYITQHAIVTTRCARNAGVAPKLHQSVTQIGLFPGLDNFRQNLLHLNGV